MRHDGVCGRCGAAVAAAQAVCGGCGARWVRERRSDLAFLAGFGVLAAGGLLFGALGPRVDAPAFGAGAVAVAGLMVLADARFNSRWRWVPAQGEDGLS